MSLSKRINFHAFPPRGAVRVPTGPAGTPAPHGDSVAPPPGCKGIVVARQGPRPEVRGQGKPKWGDSDA